MKTIKILTILITSLILTSCNGQNKKTDNQTNSDVTKIEVIDFHSTHRCFTCNAIEENTKYTLDTYFSKEMKEGKITFQIINVDEEINNKIAEKFEASGTSLFINTIKNGTEKQTNITNFAFSKGKNKDAFSTELKSKLEKELKKL